MAKNNLVTIYLLSFQMLVKGSSVELKQPKPLNFEVSVAPCVRTYLVETMNKKSEKTFFTKDDCCLVKEERVAYP